MERKYNMTKEDNIFFAKRKLVDNLYKSANLEGIIVTIEDIFYFVNNVNTGKISIDDMLKLKGLKDAWEYILSTIDEELYKKDTFRDMQRTKYRATRRV